MTEPDPVGEWRAAVERVDALISGLSAAEAATHVPACPDWTVRDLLSHMIGLDADVLDGDEPDDHNAEWTQRQVDARATHSVAELLAEWRGLVEPLSAYMRDTSPRPLGDVVIHEQDLRGALGHAGGRDTDGVAMIRQRMADRLGSALDGLPPLALIGDDGWSWASSGPVDDADVTLSASSFDLFRAVTSRRTTEQLRSWVTRGDLTDQHLHAFAGLGSLPLRPLPE